jgi:hypothetical protein
MIRVLRIFRSCWVIGALFAISGCRSEGTAQSADPASAQQALRAVLDAWKAGEKPEALENRAPPIRVKDLDWQNGFQLVRYSSDLEGKHVGYDLNYPVSLELKSPKGSSIKRNAIYTVTTRPEILVLRQEG